MRVCVWVRVCVCVCAGGGLKSHVDCQSVCVGGGGGGEGWLSLISSPTKSALIYTHACICIVLHSVRHMQRTMTEIKIAGPVQRHVNTFRRQQIVAVARVTR